MSLNQFLQVLQASTDNGEEWDTRYGIRTRKHYFEGKFSRTLCPISYVANTVLEEETFRSSEYSKAAEFLGLSEHLADLLVIASDNITGRNLKEDLRPLLLKICNKED